MLEEEGKEAANDFNPVVMVMVACIQCDYSRGRSS